MVKSYSFEKEDRTATFTVPAGVADVFQGLGVRCSVPGAMVMSNINKNGVSVVKLGISGEAMRFIAASGFRRESK